jgi:membrane protease YdiL (CAAX protease family)
VRTERRRLRDEVLLVLGVSLGASAAYSAVAIVARLTAEPPLAQQTATLNPSQAPGRPWLDLTYQLLGIFFDLVPALLAVHLLARDRAGTQPEPASGVDARAGAGTSALIGLDFRRPLFDGVSALALAAVIGLPGLGLYVAAHRIGINATVVPAALPAVWWAVPVLVLSAVQNAVLEEVVVVGYMLTRLRALGTRPATAVTASALLRGAYHLYQGFGGFIGNAVMGVVFAVFFLRTRRVMPLVVAHSVLDIVSFVGYALFKDKLGFLR